MIESGREWLPAGGGAQEQARGGAVECPQGAVVSDVLHKQLHPQDHLLTRGFHLQAQRLLLLLQLLQLLQLRPDGKVSLVG